MGTSMTAFLIRTIVCLGAMVGFLLIAYIVAKNCMNGTVGFKRKKGNLEIEESIAISPRKTLHIVKAFNERFLLASDANSTTLLAKLNDDNEIISENKEEEFSALLKEEVPIIEKAENKAKSGSVIQSMLEKLKY